MKCNNCGYKIKDDFEFCPKCGSKIIKELVCANCGTINDVDSSFCKKCGKPLTEQSQENHKAEIKEEVNKPVVKAKNKRGIKFVISIIASSLCLLSMVLIFAFLFVPFLGDRFLPTREYTIIHYLKEVFDAGISSLASNYRVVPIMNAFVCLVFLVGTGVVSLVLIGISIPKFIKAISQRSHVDLTGKLMFLFSLYLVTFVYFVGFVINTEHYYADSINGAVIFLLILVGLTSLFNLFYKEKFEKDSSTKNIILKTIIIGILIAFIFATSMLIGGNKYALTMIFESKTNKEIIGSLGLIDQILNNTNFLTTRSIGNVTTVVIFSALSFVLEIIALAFISTLSLRIINSKHPYRIGLIFSAIALTLFIANAVCDIVAAYTANQIDSISYYGAIITCTRLPGQTIAKMILCGLMLSAFITSFVLNKKEVIE